MAWLRVDDKFADNPKVEGLASDPKTHGDALAVWIILASDCARRETDGSFTPERVQKCFPTWRKSRRDAALNSLLRSKLINLVNGSFNFHDWLVYNPSKESQEKKREISRNDWTKRRNQTSDRHQTDISLMTPVPVPVPVVCSKEHTHVVLDKPKATSGVSELFDFWRLATSKPGAKLDSKRERLLGRVIKDYGFETCCDVVRGYMLSPHHTGTNDRNTPYLTIEVMFRDAKQVEQGLDYFRSGSSEPHSVPCPATEDEVWRAVVEWIDAAPKGEFMSPSQYLKSDGREWEILCPWHEAVRRVFNEWIDLPHDERPKKVSEFRQHALSKIGYDASC